MNTLKLYAAVAVATIVLLIASVVGMVIEGALLIWMFNFAGYGIEFSWQNILLVGVVFTVCVRRIEEAVKNV